MASLGDFKEDSVNASLFGERQRQAVMVYDRALLRLMIAGSVGVTMQIKIGQVCVMVIL